MQLPHLTQLLHQLHQARHPYRSNRQPPSLHHNAHRWHFATPATHRFHSRAGDYSNYSKRSHCHGHRSYHRYSCGSSYSSYRSYPSYINVTSERNWISPAAATPPVQQRCRSTGTALHRLGRSSMPASCSTLLQTAAAAEHVACGCQAAAVAAAAADDAAAAAAAAASASAASHQMSHGSC